MATPAHQARTVLGLHRFGLGARPGDLASIGGDVRDLFLDEITRRAVPVVTGVPFASHADLARAYLAFQVRERREREAKPPTLVPRGAGEAPGPMGFFPRAVENGPQVLSPQARADEPGNPGRIYREDVRTHVLAALEPLGGFGERWVAFWSNHLCISAAKGGPVRAAAGLYEREVIRPHAFGRFADMLLAAERHPAMLIYLDNQLSIGPNSRAGQNRRRGLNENLAREILELHTLGVNGGYSQADVTALARILTGWTVAGREGRLAEPGNAAFNPNAHEPGAHRVLGKTYPEGGAEQSEAVLRDLARHPATAGHLAFKIARHFVADEPAPALVEKLAVSFRATDGDLQALARTLIEAPESWSGKPVKIRSPREFLIAAMRAVGAKPTAGEILGPLAALGQRPWEPPGPNGFDDTMSAWASPEGMKARLDIAAAIGRRVAAQAPDPRQLVEAVLGAHASEATRQAVSRAESRPQAIAIALMAPEFLRR